QRLAETPAGAAREARALDGPVALKAVVPGLLEKSGAGAVRLGLAGPRAVRQAAEELQAALRAAGHAPVGFLVQRMAPPGVELTVGVVHDRQFGPVLACGAGGAAADVAVRLTPLTATDAAEMIAALRARGPLAEAPGTSTRDTAALADVLLRVSALAEDLPAVAELDLNPVVVLDTGATIVDARLRVEPAAPPLPLGARRR
ncbi:MAG TPA: acetate--CoA ligase family protein, partial [Thermomicrobiales bacterium]|nr:acetate--CoA ligase family protein [Thermomicrobiales bacterium]